ncbi:MAG: capsule biosynthesis GfcC family protein [Gammaproteobacteria bacterium]|nr:capsule biosynthesis GfcC family protein [Gammaproteobacteria bacterium]
MKRLFAAVALCTALIAPAQATVTIDGRVLQPGTYALPDDARLRDAVVAGQVRADAWFLGAAWLRPSAVEAQTRLKAGVLFDLQAAMVAAQAEGNAHAGLFSRLYQQVEAMPVTGRVVADMTPLSQLLLRNNPLLASGDHLRYPARPDHVRVMGAVTADCQLAYDPALRVRDYLRQCPAADAADASWVWLIQPDGQVQQLGVAPWNLQPANVAVGAVIMRGIHPRHLTEAPDLNAELAAFLATQYRLGGLFDE